MNPFRSVAPAVEDARATLDYAARRRATAPTPRQAEADRQAAREQGRIKAQRLTSARAAAAKASTPPPEPEPAERRTAGPVTATARADETYRRIRARGEHR